MGGCSSLRRLGGKGLWEVAQSIVGEEKVLQEYLVPKTETETIEIEKR